jgi:FAD/FMN-containing dehydrogenase
MTDTTLPDGFTGPLLRPGEPAYDEARVIFNAMIDKRPTLIAQCESPADVAAAVRYAVERGLEIAVRGGGHGVAGTGLTDGGVVVDLRRMNGAEVDPAARTITIGGGAVWADFDQACQPHGLAATGGRVSTTGVAGLTLGGGSGWFERKFGWPATTCCRSTWSPPTAAPWPRPRPRTRTCSGRCTAAVATSASPPR